jgi:branched-chain amino acid transport system substrate-binding protein
LEIKVGLSISLTGRFSLQGRQAFNGIQLWQSFINSCGGITTGPRLRRQVRLIYYDDQSRSSYARENALKLLQCDRVDILLGPYASDLTMVVAQVAEQHKKVLWNHGGSSDEIFNRGYEWLIGTGSPASQYLRAFPCHLALDLPGLRRICILQSTRGTFAAHVVRGLLEDPSVQSCSPEVLPLPTPVASACPVLQELRSVAPEVLILAGSFQEEIAIMQARQLWPDTIRSVAAVAAGVQAFYPEVHEGAEGVIGPSQWEPEVRFEDTQGPDSDWFVRKFGERFGHPPEYTAAGGFALGLVLAECIGRAGSLEDQRLRAAASELDFNTFYGKFRVDPVTGCQIGHRILLVQWQQGRKVVLPEVAQSRGCRRRMVRPRGN